MKHNVLFITAVMAAIAMTAISCGNSKSNTNEMQPLPVATSICEGVSMLEIDSATTLITLRDNAEPSSQPNNLFYGKDNKDSAKVEQLSPNGQIPSSIHAFLAISLSFLSPAIISYLSDAGYEALDAYLTSFEIVIPAFRLFAVNLLLIVLSYISLLISLRVIGRRTIITRLSTE